MQKKFRSTDRKGFHMTFENGLTASVQWGRGNYCENHFNENLGFCGNGPDAHSNDAEVAIIYKGDLIDIGNFLPEHCSHDGTVAGWLSPEDVLYFLNKVKEYNPESEV